MITPGCGFHIVEIVEERLKLTLLQQGSVEPRIGFSAASSSQLIYTPP
jgi:hypothetical protein